MPIEDELEEKLTEVDKKWMADNPKLSVLDILEEELADRMGIIPTYELAEPNK